MMMTTTMKNQNSLLLVLVSMVVWMKEGHYYFVDGYLSMGFEQNPDVDNTKCTPGKLKQVYNIFESGLTAGGWDQNNEPFPWKFRAQVEKELDKLQDECKKSSNSNNAGGNGNGNAWGLDMLSNNITTDDLVCPAPDDTNDSRRNLASEDDDDDQSEERHLLVYCNDCIYFYMYDCSAICRRRRRRNLRDSEEVLVRELTTPNFFFFNKTAAADKMYNECLGKNIPCIDCSTANMCEVKEDGTYDCATPSCHLTGTCWDF